MKLLRPADLEEALAMRSEVAGALPIAGGTSLMVELNSGRIEPPALLDLSRLDELAGCSVDGNGASPRLRLGARLTYSELIASRSTAGLPALIAAAEAVGSRQIRNRGTLGGALAADAPGGDVVAPLLVAGAEVELAHPDGSGGVQRERIRLEAFLDPASRPRRLRSEGLIVAVHVPRLDRSRFLRLGDRAGAGRTIAAIAVGADRDRVRLACVGRGLQPALIEGPLAAAGSLAERLAAKVDSPAEAPVPTDYVRQAIAVLAGRGVGECLT